MSAYRSTAVIVLAASLGTAASCNQRKGPARPEVPAAAHTTSTAASIPLPSIDDTRPRDYPGIHNAVAFYPGFISGGVPEGAAGFDTLAAMGVKTIISVDGATPDVELASAHGMRYIHLPIGYNGFNETRRLELTRATRDGLLVGPVYIHCHHGKHRSAGAAAAVAVGMGWDTPGRQVERMKVSGTSPSYTGLYAAAAEATLVPAATLDRVPAEFPSVSRPNGFVQAMVEIDAAYDHLKEIEKAGWRVPPDHPDLVPAAEAGRLADLLRVVAGVERSLREPAEFAVLMRANGEQAAALEAMLVNNPSDSAGLSGQLRLIGASCMDCHVKHRD